MECQARPSQKYLLLQVWCALLTVAMLVMAALLSSIKPKSSEDEVSTMKPNPTSPMIRFFSAPLKSEGSSLSYIQLIRSHDNFSWEVSDGCAPCSLALRSGAIHCAADSLYFLYAQVTFTRVHQANQTKAVLLVRNPSRSRPDVDVLVDGSFTQKTVGSVWVAKVVRLKEGDGVGLEITGDFLIDSTFWGAFQLH